MIINPYTFQIFKFIKSLILFNLFNLWSTSIIPCNCFEACMCRRRCKFNMLSKRRTRWKEIRIFHSLHYIGHPKFGFCFGQLFWHSPLFPIVPSLCPAGRNVPKLPVVPRRWHVHVPYDRGTTPLGRILWATSSPNSLKFNCCSHVPCDNSMLSTDHVFLLQFRLVP